MSALQYINSKTKNEINNYINFIKQSIISIITTEINTGHLLKYDKNLQFIDGNVSNVILSFRITDVRNNTEPEILIDTSINDFNLHSKNLRLYKEVININDHGGKIIAVYCTKINGDNLDRYIDIDYFNDIFWDTQYDVEHHIFENDVLIVAENFLREAKDKKLGDCFVFKDAYGRNVCIHITDEKYTESEFSSYLSSISATAILMNKQLFKVYDYFLEDLGDIILSYV